jgi:hypothetical protein
MCLLLAFLCLREGSVLGENGSLFSVCPSLMMVIENFEGAGKDSVREILWRGPDTLGQWFR